MLFLFLPFYFFTLLPLTGQYLFERNIWICFAEHVLLQLELAVLDGRDGDAVDVADGAVADPQTGEDAQADVVFLQIRILFTEMGKAIVVDGVERTFYLAPFVLTEIDE